MIEIDEIKFAKCYNNPGTKPENIKKVWSPIYGIGKVIGVETTSVENHIILEIPRCIVLVNFDYPDENGSEVLKKYDGYTGKPMEESSFSDQLYTNQELLNLVDETIQEEFQTNYGDFIL